MKATTIELDSGHLSLITHAEEIANLILQAAGAAPASKPASDPSERDGGR
ncbi:hypothetical protein [Myxococcus eversor]|nr:hypothetical protein [Myxococcus eversor]